MKKNIVAIFAVAAACALSAPASAATLVTISSGPTGVDPTMADFEAQTAQTPGSNQASPPFSSSGANFTGQGIIMNNTLAQVFGMYAPPLGDTTNYLAVVPVALNPPVGPNPVGAPETITFGSAFNRFGLYWGSIDQYNTISFYLNNVLVDSWTGQMVTNLIPATADGNQTGVDTNKFVQFAFTGTSFDKIVLDSSQNSFEVDNLSWSNAEITRPTPLPGALPMFLSAIGGGAGLLGWRKRRKAARA